MVRFAAAVILLAISACVSAEDQLAAEDQPALVKGPTEDQLAKSGKNCQSYGFSPGTDAYAECVQREVHAVMEVVASGRKQVELFTKAAWDARRRNRTRAYGR